MGLEEDETEEKSEQIIPEGYKLAGVRFRSAEAITKDHCKDIIKGMMDDLVREGEYMKEALKQTDVLEEELKGGNIKAFNLLIEPRAAEAI